MSTEFSYLKNMKTHSASPLGGKKKGVRVGRDQRHRIMSQAVHLIFPNLPLCLAWNHSKNFLEIC